MANYSDIRYVATGVTEYATADNLPTSGNTTGDQALVTGTNRLYIWNGSGWYNIALINTTPSISGVSSSYALETDGTATTVTITATDAEGLPVTYSIESDTSGNVATVTQGTGANTNVFTITPTTNTANGGTFSLTFRASDGVNIATAPASFVLQFSIENSKYTTALITSVGANLADNNDFVDSSTNSYTITAAGSTTQNTFSPYRHGGYSTYFDGTGDYLKATDHADFDMGTGNFTIELWMYADSQSTPYPALVSSSNYNSAGSSSIRFDNTGQNDKLFLYCNSASPSADPLLTSSSTLSLNEWHHVALVRDGTSLKFYVDGTENGSVTIGSGQTFDFSVGELRVGRGFDVDGANAYFTGYITDLRIVKGTAITPSSGGPTERLTAVANTSLLTCHLPYIADGSSTGHSITVNGNTKTEPFAPYDYGAPYSGSDNGGSIYFDGSGDYLTIPSGAHFADFGTANFTVEWWEYITAWTTTYFPIFHYGALGATSNFTAKFGIRYEGSGSFIRVGVSGSNFDFTSLTTPLNVWRHCAIVRSGTTATLYRNGKVDGSVTLSTDITSQNGESIFGGAYFGGGGGSLNSASGFINDLRTVKGTAVYTSAFTPPTAPLTAISGTSLLFNGTNAGIIDKSQSVQTLTLNGDVKSSTTQTKYLSSSMAFDGTGDYLDIVNDEGFNFSTSDFTIEFWMYPSAIGSENIMLESRAGHTDSGLLIMLNGSVIKNLTSGSVRTTGGTTITTGSWYHVAVVRDSTSLRTYLNGTEESGSASYTASITNPFSKFRLGARFDGANPFNGYFSDVRITKGLARYTANFTAPTTALSG